MLAMLLTEAMWGRSREVGCSTALAQTQLPAACLHFVTPSPPAAALRDHWVFIFQGCETSKK